MSDELFERLKEIEVENIIFLIFILIIGASYIANNFEKNFFIFGDEEDKKIYYYLQIIIFFFVIIINIYYVYINYNEVIKLRLENYSNRKIYAELGFIASLFALVASFIIFYIAVSDTEIDAEITL